MTTANPQVQSITYVRSSRDPNRHYLVALGPRGYYECECKAAQFNRRQPCKHVTAVAKDGAGLVGRPTRIAMDAAAVERQQGLEV